MKIHHVVVFSLALGLYQTTISMNVSAPLSFDHEYAKVAQILDQWLKLGPKSGEDRAHFEARVQEARETLQGIREFRETWVVPVSD